VVVGGWVGREERIGVWHMEAATLGDVLIYLRRLCAAELYRGFSDGELLVKFLADRDEVAFATLVKRHGAMVHGVGQRVLGDFHGAEDVFQATFLVLARRARSIRKKESVGSWLYGVAQRIAEKARIRAAIRCDRERQLRDMPKSEELDDVTWRELRGVLDEEIARLPKKCQSAIVLCYFEGKTHEQAARELGCPKRTLTNWLERGRQLLRKRLTRRGLTLSAGAMATALGEKVSGAPVGAMLVINTVKGAMSVAAGKAVAGGCISAGAVALAEEVLGGMVTLKGKLVAALLTCALAFGGAGLAGYGSIARQEQTLEGKETHDPAPMPQQPIAVQPASTVRTDVFGDPLPEGALARFGTVRFRHGHLGRGALTYIDEGKTLAVAGHWDFGACLFDANTGRPIQRLPLSGFANTCAISPDGKILLTGGDLRLIDMNKGTLVGRLYGGGYEDSTAPMVFSPDGRMIAGPKPDWGRPASGPIHLWEVTTGKILRTFQGHKESVTTVAFAPSGKLLASGGGDKVVRLWNSANGEETKRLEVDGDVDSVAFSPDGKTLAAAEGEGKTCRIQVWDIETGKLVHRLEIDELPGNTLILFSPDGKQLAAKFGTGRIQLWDPRTGRELGRWQGPFFIRSMAYSPDGKVLACAAESAIRRWDTATGKEIDPPAGHTSPLWSIRFSPDSKTLISCGSDGRILEWDLATAKLHRLLFEKPRVPQYALGFVDVSSDGKSVAMSWKNRPDINLCLVDTENRTETKALDGHMGPVASLGFSPDNKYLASAGQDGIRFWEVPAGREVKHLPEGGYCSVFSPDGSLLASCNQKGDTIHLWEVATGKKIRSYGPQQINEGIMQLLFSPDGKVIASARFPNTIEFWSTASEKLLLRLPVREQLRTMALSPSGRVLAVSLRRTKFTIGFWEVLTGQEIGRIDSPHGEICALAFAPDGRTLVSGGEDSTVLQWDIAAALKYGKSKASRLTEKQLDILWTDLAGDAAKAEQAVWTLALNPSQGVQLLKARLHVDAAPAELVAKLLTDLDSDRFALREKAAKALDALGTGAEGAMRKVLANNPTLEMRRRLEPILANCDKAALRPLRTVDALEQAHTEEARQVLAWLAKEAPNPRVADAAAAALRRLAGRVPDR
jgi:RNA polymerase sigma factor (sigma-70 family)